MFDVPWFELIIYLGIIFAMIRWYVSRVVSTHKVKLELYNKEESESKEFTAEESLTENRISAIKRINWRKTERIDFERVGQPKHRFIGSRRETVYKAIEGVGKTVSWKTGETGGSHVSLLFTEAGKFNAGLSALSKVALKNASARMMDILTGALLGIIVTLVLTMVFPQVFA